MKPHAFLEKAFKNITLPPSLTKVGCVVDPKYGAALTVVDSESSAVTNELKSLLDEQPRPGVLSPQGIDIPIPTDKPLLTKYIRTITLSENQLTPWVQVHEDGGF